MQNYFLINNLLKLKNNQLINRLKRKFVNNDLRCYKFLSGDILIITYWKAYLIYRFEGICISIKKKSLSLPETSLILRNIIAGVGVEFTISYYYHRIYNLRFADYKRKNFFYKKSKLFYLRNKINRASRIK